MQVFVLEEKDFLQIPPRSALVAARKVKNLSIHTIKDMLHGVHSLELLDICVESKSEIFSEIIDRPDIASCYFYRHRSEIVCDPKIVSESVKWMISYVANDILANTPGLSITNLKTIGSKMLPKVFSGKVKVTSEEFHTAEKWLLPFIEIGEDATFTFEEPVESPPRKEFENITTKELREKMKEHEKEMAKIQREICSRVRVTYKAIRF
jgi:hypothetical protein